MARLAVSLVVLSLAAAVNSFPLLVLSGPQLYQDSQLAGKEALTVPEFLNLNRAIDDYDENAVESVPEPQDKPQPFSFRIPKYLKMMSRARKSDGGNNMASSSSSSPS
ncbi:unnamed protein product [Lampetra planeri]